MTKQELTDLIMQTAESKIAWINFSSLLYLNSISDMVRDRSFIRITLSVLLTWCSKWMARKFAEGFCKNVNDENADWMLHTYFRTE